MKGRVIKMATQNVRKLWQYSVLVSCLFLFLTSCGNDNNEETPNIPKEPGIFILGVSPYGSSVGSVWGVVNGYSSSDYGVAVYILVRGGWWTKPYWSIPVTTIEDDGSWNCDIVTGGVDEEATEVRAYLIPLSYDPPSTGGDSSLPAELEQNAVEWKSITR